MVSLRFDSVGRVSIIHTHTVDGRVLVVMILQFQTSVRVPRNLDRLAPQYVLRSDCRTVASPDTSQTKVVYVMSMLENMLAAGGSFSEIQVSRTNRDTGESLRRISLDGILSPADMDDPKEVCKAIAASKGGTFSVGDASASVDGFTAAVGYNADATLGLDVTDLADIAIGGTTRDQIAEDARLCSAHLAEQRAKIETAAREARKTVPTVENVEA